MIEQGVSVEKFTQHEYEFETGLKDFGPNGLEKLLVLEQQAFDGHGEDAFTLKVIDEIGFIIGAISTNDGSLLGAVEMLSAKVPKYPGGAFIHGVLVRPDKQYKGLGASLIKVATQIAFNAGFDGVSATISPTNGPSLNAFLNKNHYAGLAFHKDYYGPGEHRIWVHKYSQPAHNVHIQEQNFLQEGTMIGGKLVEADDYETLNNEMHGTYSKFVYGVVPAYKAGSAKNLLFLHTKPEKV